MNKQFWVIFASVFVAEIGDKTQLATLLFTTDRQSAALEVFFASAGALVLSSAIAVVAGATITRFVPLSLLKVAAGVGFILIGLWTLLSARS